MIGYKELAVRLRYLVSLNEPENGGPYGGYAAAEFVKAGAEAASAIESQQARIEALEIEIEAVKSFGGGFFGERVAEATRDVYRSQARARLALQENTDDRT